MRFYLYQLNGKLGDMQANAQKILAFAKNLENDSCTLLPSLPLVQHPYAEISHVGGFLDRARKEYLDCSHTNILFESFAADGSFSWETRGGIVQNEKLFKLGDIAIFAPHCPQCGFAEFLENLSVPHAADLVYFAAAHQFYEGFAVQTELAGFAKKHKKNVVYVNACGASDGTIFAGQSMLFSAQGHMLLQLAPFSEDSAYFDFDGKSVQAENKNFPSVTADGMLFLAAKQAVCDYARKSGIKRAVIGLSGGMDSALVAAITCEALGSGNVTGIIMPSKYNAQTSMDDAINLAKNLGMTYYIMPISEITRSFESALAPSFANEEPFSKENDTTFENIQARTRGNLLTAFANRIGAMVIGTGNKSEAAMGYCTLYGDTVGAMEPIADIYKSRAYRVARWFNDSKKHACIPENIFTKAPSAELRPGQKDEDSLPPYPYLDAVLHQLLEEGKDPETITEEHLSTDDIMLIYRRLKTSEFKRKQCPFPVILTSCPFGGKWNPSASAKVF